MTRMLSASRELLTSLLRRAPTMNLNYGAGQGSQPCARRSGSAGLYRMLPERNHCRSWRLYGQSLQFLIASRTDDDMIRQLGPIRHDARAACARNKSGAGDRRGPSKGLQSSSICAVFPAKPLCCAPLRDSRRPWSARNPCKARAPVS